MATAIKVGTKVQQNSNPTVTGKVVGLRDTSRGTFYEVNFGTPKAPQIKALRLVQITKAA